MAVTRWPGARPSHAAVTSRLIGIVHRARVYACLLKTSLGTHVSLCVSVCVSVGGSRTEQTHVYRSEPLSSQSANLRCYSGVCMPIANPYRHSQTSGRIVFVLEVLTWRHSGRPIVDGSVIVPVHSNRVVLSMIFLRFLCGFISIFHYFLWIRKGRLRIENPSDVAWKCSVASNYLIVLMHSICTLLLRFFCYGLFLFFLVIWKIRF